MRSRRRLILFALLMLSPSAAGAAEKPSRVFLLDGSTLAESAPRRLIRGWGQFLGAHISF